MGEGGNGVGEEAEDEHVGRSGGLGQARLD